MTVLGLTFGAHTKFSILLTLLLGSLEVVHKFIMSESNLNIEGRELAVVLIMKMLKICFDQLGHRIGRS